MKAKKIAHLPSSRVRDFLYRTGYMPPRDQKDLDALEKLLEEKEGSKDNIDIRSILDGTRQRRTIKGKE